MEFICQADEIADGTARGYLVAGQSLIVVKFDQRSYVYRNRCPHLGIPLQWQQDEFMDPGSELLRCATHGALFLPDSGECIAGPCAGDRLTAAEFVVKEGKLYLTQALKD